VSNEGEKDSKGGTGPIALLLAWGFVGIPLLWGVAMTLANAIKLFR
jgi:hypothetical protein